MRGGEIRYKEGHDNWRTKLVAEKMVVSNRSPLDRQPQNQSSPRRPGRGPCWGLCDLSGAYWRAANAKDK